MKNILAAMAVLSLAACTANPSMDAPRTVNAAPPQAPAAQMSGSLLGISTASLLQRLGEPALRVQEGDGLMLQFRGAACILDAYAYSSGGERRVSHVDARDINGRDVNREACIAALDAAR